MTQYKKNIFLAAIFALVSTVLFQVLETAAVDRSKECLQNNKKIVGRIIYILDGDSFVSEIGGSEFKIRLWGIDCPEYNQPGGEDAKMFLSSLVMRKKVFLTLKDIDKYGRLVVIAENIDGVLNEQLVSHGHAWVYGYYCREQVCRRWQKLEEAAREKRLGVWKNDTPVPPWMWKRKK